MDAAAHPAELPLKLREVEAALGNSRLVSLFETREPDQAAAYMAGLYGPHALELTSRAPLRMRVRGFEFARLHLGEVRYGSAALASMTDPQRCWTFAYLRHGQVERGGHAAPFGPGEAGVMAPADVQTLQMSGDMELLNLRVAEADMRSACRALIGNEPAGELRFAERAPAGAAPTAALLRVMGHLAATPRYAHPAAARLESSLRDAALYELLLAWPNSIAAQLEAGAALPAATRRACDYIHAHAAELPTVAEIARAAGVGVRALARGFQKHLGVSPLRYLLHYRLDAVRASLLAADRETTVTDIATGWGFLQLGSFAVRYRDRFGETPSQTLRRQR